TLVDRPTRSMGGTAYEGLGRGPESRVQDPSVALPIVGTRRLRKGARGHCEHAPARRGARAEVSRRARRVASPRRGSGLPAAPRAEALDVVCRSRLAVVLAQEQELQIPAKLYESVAMGVPTLVVAPAGSAAGVEGHRVGAIVRDSHDVEGIASVLEQVWRDGSGRRLQCPVPITYEAIAPVVDELLQNGFAPVGSGDP